MRGELYNDRGSVSPARRPSAVARPDVHDVARAAAAAAPAHRGDAHDPAPGHRRQAGRPRVARRRHVRHVHAALPRRGRAAQRTHRAARPLRRPQPLHRRRLPPDQVAHRATACSAATARCRPTASGSTSTAGATASARSTSRSTPPACCPTASTSTTPATRPTGTPCGKRRSPTPATATPSSSASRCRRCASRRCRCRTGASRSGASSTRARRPTTGRSTRAAPAPTCRCSAGWTNLVGLDPRHRHRAAPVRARTRRPPLRRRRRDAGPKAGRRRGSVGLDAKLHVTNELTLDVALNPDFGQVEADAVILNLSTFETFFPEKRPFFLEGIDTFAGIRPVVYTRRIGGLPLVAALGPSETLVANPDPSPLYGAAKLVGTIGGRTNVGVISAITGATDVDVQRLDGARERRRIDPWTAYNIARVKRTLGANTERRAAGDGDQPAGGADRGRLAVPGNRPADRRRRPLHQRRLRRHRRRALALAARPLRASRGKRSAARCRAVPNGRSPTASRSVPATSRAAGRCYVGKEGGTNWLWSFRQYLSGRKLEFNDVGYLERKNDYQGYLAVTYRTLQPWWRTIETNTTLQAEPAPDAGRPEPVERDQARDVVEHPQLLVVLPGRARARPVLR